MNSVYVPDKFVQQTMITLRGATGVSSIRGLSGDDRDIRGPASFMRLWLEMGGSFGCEAELGTCIRLILMETSGWYLLGGFFFSYHRNGSESAITFRASLVVSYKFTQILAN